MTVDEAGVTAPRQIVAGETYLITRRCTRREYLLRPDPETTRIFEYCLAEASSRYGIGLIAWTAMSNHYHAVVHDPEGCLPAFLEHLHKLIAKVMNARWQRRENFWSTEETCVTRLVTNQDIFDKVVYVLCNPVAADLVDRAHDWPGASSLGHLQGQETVHRRPTVFFREDGVMPESATLTMTLPRRITKNESTTSWRERVLRDVAKREQRLREERIADKRRVLGRKSVQRISPADSPKAKPEPSGRRPALACRSAERRILELAALKEFRERYKIARKAWSAGNRRVQFPLGTYRLLSFGVRCTPPRAKL